MGSRLIKVHGGDRKRLVGQGTIDIGVELGPPCLACCVSRMPASRLALARQRRLPRNRRESGRARLTWLEIREIDGRLCHGHNTCRHDVLAQGEREYDKRSSNSAPTRPRIMTPTGSRQPRA